MVLDNNTMQGALAQSAGVPAHSRISAQDAALEGQNFNDIQMANQLAAMQGRDNGFTRGA